MSKKKTAQNWYQVHKARAGEESVARSKTVAIARDRVRELENQLSTITVGASDSLASVARRLLFGRNPIEEQAHQIRTQLTTARNDASAEEREARIAGGRAYGADWAYRNPDKVK